MSFEDFYEAAFAVRSGEENYFNLVKGGIKMLFGGIDWSDHFLDFHLRTADGRVLAQGQVESGVEGLSVGSGFLF